MDFETSLAEANVVFERHPSIVKLCKEKTVLHIGCVDAGLLDERFNSGELLHSKLHAVAAELWGIDIDSDGIAFLESKNLGNVFVCDLTTGESSERLSGVRFDVIVLSEVLEHLPSPGAMLSAVHALCQPSTLLVVSVPNAFSFPVLSAVFRRKEHVHPDHNCYYSPTTLRTTLRKGGFEVLTLSMYTFMRPNDFLVLPRRLRQAAEYSAGGEDCYRSNAPFIQRLKRCYWSWIEQRRKHGSLGRAIANRLAATILFSRSGYWSEGLIAICRSTHSE